MALGVSVIVTVRVLRSPFPHSGKPDENTRSRRNLQDLDDGIVLIITVEAEGPPIRMRKAEGRISPNGFLQLSGLSVYY